MSQENGDNGESVDYSQLYVYAGPEQPDPSNMTVYASGEGTLHGHPVQANIIGSSHYISVPGLQYREMTSCRPIQMVSDFKPNIRRYTIDGIRIEPNDCFTRHAGPFEVEVRLRAVKHDPFTDHRLWDLVHTFEGDGPSAPTGILFTEQGWETVHVYPEFDVDLYTSTRFKERDR